MVLAPQVVLAHSACSKSPNSDPEYFIRLRPGQRLSQWVEEIIPPSQTPVPPRTTFILITGHGHLHSAMLRFRGLGPPCRRIRSLGLSVLKIAATSDVMIRVLLAKGVARDCPGKYLTVFGERGMHSMRRCWLTGCHATLESTRQRAGERYSIPEPATGDGIYESGAKAGRSPKRRHLIP